MERSQRPFRNIILPAVILAPVLFLLVGCFYLPWFETKARPSQKDFRPLLGSSSSHRIIRPGSITRAQIENVLGPPPYLSLDGTAIGYDLRTITALWVYPLCFAVDRANVRMYVVKFNFDSSGLLSRYDLAHDDAFCPWIASGVAELEVGRKAFQDVNRFGSPIRMAAIVRYENSTRPASSQP